MDDQNGLFQTLLGQTGSSGATCASRRRPPKMPSTPRPLLDALDFITSPKEPKAEVESLHARQVRKVRAVFEDPNIVGVGVSKKVSEEKDTGVLAVCFYVEKKLPPAKVSGKHFIPPVVATLQGRSAYT